MMDIENLDRLLVQVRRIEDHRVKGAEKEIKKTYKALLDDLRHYMADVYTNYADGETLNYAELQTKGYYARFLEEVEKKINDITPDVREFIKRTVDEAYEIEYNGMIECLRKKLPNNIGTGIPFCTQEVLRRAVDNPISGLTLSDRLEQRRKEVVYDIKKNISVGILNGDRYTTMANRIKNSVDGDFKKSIRIVRTETHRVREAGKLDAAKDSMQKVDASSANVQMTKTWRTMKDERVRPNRGIGKKPAKSNYNHVKMEGVTLPIDEDFVLPSGATAPAPAQTGVAGEDINCRCRLSYSFKRIYQIKGGIKAVNKRTDEYDIREFSKTVNADFADAALNELSKAKKLFGEINVTSISPLDPTVEWDGEYLNGRIELKNIIGDNAVIKLGEKAKKMKERGKWSTSSYLHSLRHEIGHDVFETAKTKDDFKLKNEEAQIILDSIKKEAENLEEPQKLKLYSRYVSVYAISDVDEFVAECIAEYMNGSKKCRSTAKTVAKLFIIGG